MLWSKLFIPTLREDPAEARDATHRLLIRAGYMRRQDYLLLGRRALRKIVSLIREELDAIGAQEMLTGSPGAMFAIANELRSYKQLPQMWYQFDGLTVEVRIFGDAVPHCKEAILRVLDRCGLEYIDGGREFIALSESGDAIVRGPGYAANLEFAESRAQPPAISDPEGSLTPEEFHTPAQKTIADIAAFTRLPETSQMKSVVMVADGKPVLAMLRGDHQLSEAKLRATLSVTELRPAKPEEIREWFGADAGSLGPVGVNNILVFADEALRGRRNMICGANKNDYHLRNVTPAKDFVSEFLDLRSAAEGDTARDGSPLAFEKGITLARLLLLRKSIVVTSEDGGPLPAPAVSCRMFLDRMLNAAVEQRHDPDGIALFAAIAPFAVVLTPVSNDQQRSARELYDSLRASGIDALLDDRDERPGVKFKDADLIGLPYRVTLGKKLAQGVIEIRDRRARTSQDVPLSDALSFLTGKLK